jgi:hypothetical protein
LIDSAQDKICTCRCTNKMTTKQQFDQKGAASQETLIIKAEHRFRNELSIAKAELDVLYPRDQWTTETVYRKTIISKLSLNSLMYPFVRGDSFYAGEQTERIISVIQNMTATRKEWDQRCDSVQILEVLDNYSLLLYAVQKGQFPVSARDLGLVTCLERTSDSCTDFISISIEDSKVPKTPRGLVRGYTKAMWRLVQKPDGVDVTYIVYADPKGYVPSSIFRMVQNQLAQCVDSVHQYLKEKGPNMWILATDTYYTSDTFRFKSTGTFTPNGGKTEFVAQAAGIIYIGIPPKHESKVAIKVQGADVKVSVVQHEMGEFQLLEFKISNQSYPTNVSLEIEPCFEFTLNGILL